MQELETAVAAARKAGTLLKQEFGKESGVDRFESHDIKLELDVRSQELITNFLLAKYPDHALYGEEGTAGNPQSSSQWIVDPIDGTVNYFYGIPHFCISIALRREGVMRVGVIYDPMRDELWTVTSDGPAQLNGQTIRTSPRRKLADAVLTVGFAKSKSTIDRGLPLLEKLVYKVRKCRMLGSAALDLAYVATGRLDAYIESSISLWDIAAGQLLVERAGGRFDCSPSPEGQEKFSVVASNGNLDFEGLL